MLSRQDNENIYLMYSDMPHFWYTKELIAKPTYPWEFVQLGNCGSPIETEAGWLVLTHGVGPMRKYAMGAFLLDLRRPLARDRPAGDAAAGAERQRARGLRAERRLQLRRRRPRPRADHPLRHVRLRQHLRHRPARRRARRDDAGVKRLREFGPNRVKRIAETRLVVRLLKGFAHFFALILWIAAGIAFLAEWQDPGAGMAALGFTSLGVTLVNGVLSFWQ